MRFVKRASLLSAMTMRHSQQLAFFARASVFSSEEVLRVVFYQKRKSGESDVKPPHVPQSILAHKYAHLKALLRALFSAPRAREDDILDTRLLFLFLVFLDLVFLLLARKKKKQNHRRRRR